jgi:hypothetical protein
MTTMCRRTALLAALVSMLIAAGVNARPHKCIDAQGKVTYSDTLCPETRGADPVALASPQRITVKQVEAMVAAAEAAARRKDYDKLMSFYSDDAIVEIVVRIGHRTGRKIMHKRELGEYLRRHRSDTSERNAQRGKMSIDIAANGMQAETREKVTENLVNDGKRVSVTYEEQNLIEMRDGKLQVTHGYLITDAAPLLVQ